MMNSWSCWTTIHIYLLNVVFIGNFTHLHSVCGRALQEALAEQFQLKRYYFGRFELNTSCITLSMITAAELPVELKTIKKTGGMPLVRFEDANVELGNIPLLFIDAVPDVCVCRSVWFGVCRGIYVQILL